MTEESPKAGQPQIYVGTEPAPGGGRRFVFIQTHGRVPIHICISKQDYETLLRDAGGHPEEWCGKECGCYLAGSSNASEPPDRLED